MNNSQYLNEEKYQQTKGKVKNVGKILLIFGIIALVLGIILIILGLLVFGKNAENAVNSFYNDSSISSSSSVFLEVLE